MHMSTFEWRKEAPFHYLAKADNARACAFRLSHHKNDNTDYPKACGYHGTPEIGFYEGYLREAAIALELIIKAVINISNENLRRQGKETTGMPKHHRLPELWLNANLPRLSELDTLRLRTFQEILEWSGRYPTPRNEEIWHRDSEETMPPPIDPTSRFKIRKPISLGWDEFERLYGIAATKFSEIHNKNSGF